MGVAVGFSSSEISFGLLFFICDQCLEVGFVGIAADEEEHIKNMIKPILRFTVVEIVKSVVL